MSFSRATLKGFAKNELRSFYWPAFLTCLIGGLLGGYASGGSAGINLLLRRGADSDGYGRYMNPSHWHYASSEMDYLMRSSVRFFWVILPMLALGLLLGLMYAVLVANPLRVGMARYFTQAPKGERQVSDLLWAYKSGHIINIGLTMLFAGVIVSLGFVFFVIPGVIFFYMLRMVPYILAQEPWLSPSEVLKKSAAMTRGDKFNIFVLDLSFIGWNILGALFFGIGGFFISPYVEGTFAQLYGALTYKISGFDPYGAARM